MCVYTLFPFLRFTFLECVYMCMGARVILIMYACIHIFQCCVLI